MAQEVEYHANDVLYTEGPFVICNPCGNGWRIEVECVGYHCPVLPDASLHPLLRSFQMNGRTHNKNLAVYVCNLLNKRVVLGEIFLKGNVYVIK
jgi:hypothetical protein